MRKRKTVTIDGKEITVKELTVSDLLEILESVKAEPVDKGMDLVELVKGHLAKLTDATLDQFRNMTPSEIQEVYNAFREVNSVFFEMADRSGLNVLAARMKETLIADLSGLAHTLLKPGT